MPSATRSRTISAFSISLLLTLLATTAHAQIRLDLPAQPLAQSLTALGTLAHLNVLFDPSVVDGLQAPALKAELSADDALSRLLSGTKLHAIRVDANTIRVVASSPPRPVSLEQQKLQPKATSEDSAGNSSGEGVRLAQADSAKTAIDSSDETASNESSRQNDKNQRSLEEVLVTGTHIRGIDNYTNPVIVINRAQIDQTGYSTTQDLFRALPQNFASGNAIQDGTYSSDPNRSVNADYSSGINLRGLGVTSTLVLLNGHRIAPSAFGTVVDVSSIPLPAIDRIEILTDGSSAIYGSDAVGGVVNIILKKDYQGADTTLRYGATSGGGDSERTAAQVLGGHWQMGDIVGTLQFRDQNALPASDRDFTASLPAVNDLLPSSKSYAATLDGRQSITSNLELYGDVLLSKRDFNAIASTAYPPPRLLYTTDTDGDSRGASIAPGLRYRFSQNWSLELSGLYARQQATYTMDEGFKTGTPTEIAANNIFNETSVDLVLNGHWHATPAGDIGVAVGASYRREKLDSLSIRTPGSPSTVYGQRHVSAAFGEFYIPVVSQGNRLPLVEALEFSAAARIDKYSDFGSTATPRVGLRWAPLRDVSLKASYGKSFRAPSLEEESQQNPAIQQLYTFVFANPAGPGTVPVLIAYGSKPLSAERAETSDFGIEYSPASIHDLDVSLTYYNVLYKNRIIVPTFDTNALLKQNIYGSLISPISSDSAAQQIVDEARASGVLYTDYVGTGVEGVRYLYSDQQQNIAILRQSGIDFAGKWISEVGASYSVTGQVNGSYVDRIDTQYSSGAASNNLVNTFGNPVKWRGRFDSGISSKRWSISAAVNMVGSYKNSVAIGAPREISSWTTLDLNLTVDVGKYFDNAALRGTSLSLIALNSLNRDPPYVAVPSLIKVNYDATNANPLGRYLALSLRKQWQ